jgi:chromosome partitioning protein
VANQKGGVAKTTTVASLGAAMADSGKRVLLVDLDPQGCLTFRSGQDPDKLPVSVHEVLLGEVEPNAALVQTAEGMTLLPANIDLAGAEAMLLMGRARVRSSALAKVADDFDGDHRLPAVAGRADAQRPDRRRRSSCRCSARRWRTAASGSSCARSPTSSRSPTPTWRCSARCPRCTTRAPPQPRRAVDVADRYQLPVLAPPIPRTVRFAEATASGRRC